MIKGFNLIRPGTTIPFMGMHRIMFLFSTILVVSSVVIFGLRGMNLGIDFQGGIMIEVRSEGPADLALLRSSLGSLGLGEVNLQTFGAPNEVMIRVQRQEGDEKAQQLAVDKIKQTLGAGYENRRTEFVGPKVSEELFKSGIEAVSFAILAILVYIWFRFEWQFGVGAVVALVHDILSTIGLFALTQMEFNLTTVAAVLTIAGYSINDTVVVYDRVRENLRRYKSKPLPELLDLSINDTLSRTTMTSFTTLLALFALYVLGGEVIRGFSIALIWGIVIGTYSSIFLAVPLMLYMKLPNRSADATGDDGAASAEGA